MTIKFTFIQCIFIYFFKVNLQTQRPQLQNDLNMRVLTYGGYRNIAYVKIGNKIWPCTPQTAASKIFFGAIDLSKTFEDEKFSGITYYENPELYWQTRISKPHIDDFSDSENPQQDYQQELEKYIQELQTFKENQKQWYANKKEMIKDMGTFISKLRYDKSGRYPENGYDCYINASNDEIYEIKEF